MLYVASSVSLRRDADGDPIGFRGIIRDVSESRLAQVALRISEEKYRTILESIEDGYFEVDLAGNFTFFNDAACTILGYTPDEMMGLNYREYVDHDTAQRVYENFNQVYRSSRPNKFFGWDIIRRDGSKSYFETSVSLITNAEGEAIGFRGIFRDVSERRLYELALKLSTDRLTVLRAIDRAIVAAHSPAEIAEAALVHIRHLVPCLQANVTVWDSDKLEATILAIDSQTHTSILTGTHLAIDRRSMRELSAGKVRIWKNTSKLLRLNPSLIPFHEEGMRAFTCVPIIAAGKLIGSLNLVRGEVGSFPLDQLSVAREIADLLAIAMQQASLTEQIERHTEELEQRVAERTSDLEAINEELKALSQVKDEFVANVSHELRSPITSIKLHHHLVGLRPGDIGKLLPVLDRETQRLERIIEDLLRLSRMDIGEVSLELTKLDLNQLVVEYVADRAPMAASSGRLLQLGKRDTVPPVMADEGLMGQVLGSLLTNALNYSPQGSVITVGTGTRQISGKTWVGISVSDNGDGITPEEMNHLFERFYRGVAGHKSGEHGTGLGLSIVHEIVTRHGGQVEVESEGLPGQGATFHVWLVADAEEDLHG